MYKTGYFINFKHLQFHKLIIEPHKVEYRKAKKYVMKHRIYLLKAAALLILLSHLSSCTKHIHTDNKRPPKYKYRNAGRAW